MLDEAYQQALAKSLGDPYVIEAARAAVAAHEGAPKNPDKPILRGRLRQRITDTTILFTKTIPSIIDNIDTVIDE